MADVVVKSYFLQYGKPSPANSEFKGDVNQESMFGGFFEYTHRKKAIKDSMNVTSDKFNDIDNSDDGQNEITDSNEYKSDMEFWNVDGTFIGYTSRGKATKKSVVEGEYFTMSDQGKLFSPEERIQWVENSKKYFSKDGDIAWALVISLDNYDLLNRFGLVDQNDFARITQQCLQSSLRKMKLDPTNFIWWEDYHTNTEHPHMHITFIEKDKTRTRGKFTERELETLKRSFVSTIAARAIYREKYKTDSVDVLKSITSDRKEIVQQSKKFGYETINKIANLYSQLPASGRLQYNSVHIAPYRDQLDEIVDDILHTEDVKPLYDDFMEKMQTLDDVMNNAIDGNINHMKENQDKKLRVQIANSILSDFKNLKRQLPKTMQEDKVNGIIGSKVMLSIIDDVCSKSTSLDEINICDMIKKGKYKQALEFTQTLKTENKTFLLSSIEYLKGDTENSHLSAISKLNGDKKNVYSKHFMNWFRKSSGLSKGSYTRMKRSLSSGLLSETKRSVRAAGKAVEDEIEAFISNSKHIVNSNGYQRAAESLAKETERDVEQANYDRDSSV